MIAIILYKYLLEPGMEPSYFLYLKSKKASFKKIFGKYGKKMLMVVNDGGEKRF
jgi:hypothetical protein